VRGQVVNQFIVLCAACKQRSIKDGYEIPQEQLAHILVLMHGYTSPCFNMHVSILPQVIE
jgi:hypothetical protein